eukprot:gnl/TRDRNA2_/TRDRNA2_183951_c0_seq1.p1 gnl/TRDRNA2_/TRDRNA2_183951_c0~~gnl/TRDRNA2_/TRDRNA2_183951_c0_seq1.p1  ORF type:complete len:506 (+),score=95.05 gnl/TRDRNA2_/TRDRNA2_183951_c0_seq1:212-1729(+)
MGCGASSKAKAAPEEAPPPVGRGNVVVHHEISDDIGKYYDIDKTAIRKAGFGFVRKAVNKQTNREHAVRFISKANRSRKDIDAEVETMKYMDHPNIMNLFEVFEDQVHYNYVVELCAGGPLFDTIFRSPDFNESIAAVIMQQVVRGINYMHENSVCHRNLQPQGLLLHRAYTAPTGGSSSIEATWQIRIADMSRAIRFAPGQRMQGTVCSDGSTGFASPQMLKGDYDQSCDMWSCGAILYTMLSGQPPFGNGSNKSIGAKLRELLGDFTPSAIDGVTHLAWDFIQKLLVVPETTRFTAAKALGHEWLEDPCNKIPSTPLTELQLDNMKKFCAMHALKKNALHVIARHLSEDEINDLKANFETLDKNQDGVVSFKELVSSLPKSEQMKAAPGGVNEFFNDVDINGNQCMDYSEFVAAALSKKHYQQESICWAAFRAFDTDGSGQISQKELQKVIYDESVKEMMGSNCVEAVLKSVDLNGDGKINFKEFFKMMRPREWAATPCPPPL